MKITVYTKPNCPNCVALKNFLNVKKVTFDTIELDFGQTTENPKLAVENFKTQFPGIAAMPFFTLEDNGVVKSGNHRDLMAIINQK